MNSYVDCYKFDLDAISMMTFNCVQHEQWLEFVVMPGDFDLHLIESYFLYLNIQHIHPSSILFFC